MILNRTYKNRLGWITLLFTLVNTFLFTNVIAEKSKTRLSLSYFYNANKTITLEAKLTTKQEQRTVPAPDLPIKFYMGIEDGTLLGESTTNNDGKALLHFGNEVELAKDSGGYVAFYAEFEGSELFSGSSSDVSAREAHLEISFFQKDSTKSILLKGFEVDKDGNQIPLDNVDVSFFVPRTFSLLKFAEGQFANGEYILDFPMDIPGDTERKLTIIAKIVEHDDYGTVSAEGYIDWGMPLAIIHEAHRGLGDVDAPLWMVYALIVLMSGVWGHYLYVLFSIYRIKQEEKNQ